MPSYHQRIAPLPASPGAAIDLLCQNIERGATIVAIGAATNLALLGIPTQLGRATVVFMGGWMQPPAPGCRTEDGEMDWNVQCDTQAAQVLARAGELTLVTLPATLTDTCTLPTATAAGIRGRSVNCWRASLSCMPRKRG